MIKQSSNRERAIGGSQKSLGLLPLPQINLATVEISGDSTGKYDEILAQIRALNQTQLLEMVRQVNLTSPFVCQAQRSKDAFWKNQLDNNIECLARLIVFEEDYFSPSSGQNAPAEDAVCDATYINDQSFGHGNQKNDIEEKLKDYKQENDKKQRFLYDAIIEEVKSEEEKDESAHDHPSQNVSSLNNAVGISQHPDSAKALQQAKQSKGFEDFGACVKHLAASLNKNNSMMKEIKSGDQAYQARKACVAILAQQALIHNKSRSCEEQKNLLAEGASSSLHQSDKAGVHDQDDASSEMASDLSNNVNDILQQEAKISNPLMSSEENECSVVYNSSSSSSEGESGLRDQTFSEESGDSDDNE